MNDCEHCKNYQALAFLTKELVRVACKSSSDLKPFELGNIIDKINELGVKTA